MNTRMIALPKELCETAEQKFSARFNSVSELLTALLTELVREDATRMDEREQQVIEERLRALGYV